LYDQTMGDTHALFRDAQERFAEVVAGMKQMAGEMQRELDVTRAELRRGIFDLPQETAESAAQMRRVIVDQIEALAELNRIVARHGRSLDAVEPVRRGEPSLAIVGGRSTAEYTTRAPSQPPRDLPPREASSFAPPPRRESPPSAPNQGAQQRSGWLSDLLTRASREEGEAAPQQRDLPPREPPRASPPRDMQR